MRTKRTKFVIPQADGDTVEIKGEKYTAVAVPFQNLCTGCVFHRRGEPCTAGGNVLCVWEGQNYIFKEIETL